MYERLRNLREDSNWTQQTVADQLSMKRRTYSAYETGVNAMSPETLIKLAAIYQTNVDYLLGLTNCRQPYPPKQG